MKTTTKLWLAIGLASLGCSSTGVGNPGVAMQSLSVSSDSEAEPGSSDAAEQLDPANLRHAILVFGEVRYLACDPTEDVVVDGPVVVDLATNHVEPEIAPVVIPASGFCGIDATLAPAASPPAVAGRSMFFSGLRSDGTLFLLFVDMPGTLRMRPLDGATWPSDGEHRWLWKLRPRRWLAPSELDAAETAALDGIGQVIAIDVNRHPVLYEAIRTRIARRSTLYLDLDDNNRLDAEERLDGAILGQGLDSID